MKQFIILLLTIFSLTAFAQEQKSTRKERNYIVEGNKLYEKKDYKKAEEAYNLALKENPMSYRAMYNKALTQIRIGEDEDLKDEKKKQLLTEGVEIMQKIAELGAIDPHVASMANYNLGNIAFKSQDYASAINAYKQSLRLDPSSDKARKNLRIAQKKLQNQQNQQNQDNQNDKDNQQNSEQQQKQEQNKQDKQDKSQQNQNEEKQKRDHQQPQDGELSQQSANQILQSIENKESSVRQRLQRQWNKGQKNSNNQRPHKKW